MRRDMDGGVEAESYGAYADTLLRFEDGPAVDLRAPLRPWDAAALRRLGLGERFAVLGAANPGGTEPEDLPPDEADRLERENVRRVLRLEEALALRGIPFHRVEARSPDGLHRERCVAVALGRGEAEALARERDQLALFWFDGDRFWLWPAVAPGSPEPLPAP